MECNSGRSLLSGSAVVQIWRCSTTMILETRLFLRAPRLLGDVFRQRFARGEYNQGVRSTGLPGIGIAKQGCTRAGSRRGGIMSVVGTICWITVIAGLTMGCMVTDASGPSSGTGGVGGSGGSGSASCDRYSEPEVVSTRISVRNIGASTLYLGGLRRCDPEHVGIESIDDPGLGRWEGLWGTSCRYTCEGALQGWVGCDGMCRDATVVQLDPQQSFETTWNGLLYSNIDTPQECCARAEGCPTTECWLGSMAPYGTYRFDLAVSSLNSAQVGKTTEIIAELTPDREVVLEVELQ